MSLLAAICRHVERANRLLGWAVAWLVVFMMLVQFALVVMRYVFGVGSLMVTESILYAHALVFMLAAAWTLADDRHVRVDIFYGAASPRRQAMVDLFGTVVFLLPVCGLVWYVGYPYVARSWAVLEGSRETSGIPGIFLLKTCILVFAVTLGLQGLVLAARAAAFLAGRPMPGDPRRGDG